MKTRTAGCFPPTYGIAALCLLAALLIACVSGGTATTRQRPAAVVHDAVFAASPSNHRRASIRLADTESQPTLRVVARTARDEAGTSIASGVFDDDVELDGWGKLTISTSSDFSDEEQAYAAGWLEGELTAERIWQNHVNTWTAIPDKIVAWLALNEAWMLARIVEESETSDYWQHVNLLLLQTRGMFRGYESAMLNSTANQTLSWLQFVALSAGDDIGDLIMFLEPSPAGASSLGGIWGSKCSSLVRVTPTSLLVGHDTWSEYNTALRIAKAFTMNFTAVKQGSARVSFTSYPGFINSDDDFLVAADTNMTVAETTGDVFNMSLARYITTESVLTWIRSMVATRMATSGGEWADVFTRYNSGTYNNEWLIVDHKRFSEGKLESGALTILEQLPGTIESRDCTDDLKSQGYFASYNVWNFSAIFALSGEEQMVNKFNGSAGLWFTHDQTPRALIFAARAAHVESVADMQWLMQYQRFETDPLQLGYPENGIAARSDLANNTDVPFPALGPRCHGAIDSKVSTCELVSHGQFFANGAMTHVDQPVFSWSTASPACANFSHVGLPDRFDFDWVTFTPDASLWINK